MRNLTMNDNNNEFSSQLTEVAREMVEQADQNTANADRIIKRFGVDETLRQQIMESRQQIKNLINQIDTVRLTIENERKPAQQSLKEIETTLQQAREEENRILTQISEKEKEIDKLVKQKARTKVWRFGDAITPDVEAINKAGALRVEVAGLYSALGSAKRVLATTLQQYESLQIPVSHIPIESDPRFIELFKELEAEKEALSLLIQEAASKVKMTFQEIFTKENKEKIIQILKQKISTGFPDELETDLLHDVIDKSERIFIDVLPAKFLKLVKNPKNGLKAGAKFKNKITKIINNRIDVPLLNEEEEKTIIEELVDLIIKSMDEGNSIEICLESA